MFVATTQRNAILFSIVYVLYIYIWLSYHFPFIIHSSFYILLAANLGGRLEAACFLATHTYTHTHVLRERANSTDHTHTNTKSKMKTIHGNMGITQNIFRCGSYKYIQRIHRNAFLYVIMIQPAQLIRTLITYW
jgi:hypothetical protein